MRQLVPKMSFSAFLDLFFKSFCLNLGINIFLWLTDVLSLVLRDCHNFRTTDLIAYFLLVLDSCLH